MTETKCDKCGNTNIWYYPDIAFGLQKHNLDLCHKCHSKLEKILAVVMKEFLGK